jgi:hypothetical protein
MRLYKLRSIREDGHLYALDAMVNERIFLSTCTSMNDINEGQWECVEDCVGDKKIRATAEEFRKFVDSSRFTCFVKGIENHLMWAHYAGGFTGVAFEYEIDDEKHDIRPIDYDGMPKIEEAKMLRVLAGEKRPQDFGVLKQKDPGWKYEDEWRLFANDRRQYLTGIRPLSVVMGNRESVRHETLAKVARLLGIRIGNLVPGPGTKLEVSYEYEP